MNRDYQRIAGAIHYLQRHVTEQPALATVAAAVNLSPSHFQRLFKRWAGVSPKQYLQYLTVEYSKQLLHNSSSLETMLHTGLSSTSRLHEHYIRVSAVTPAQYRNAGKDIEITYGIADSPFGMAALAITKYGVCTLQFMDSENKEVFHQSLRQKWKYASLKHDDRIIAALVQDIFSVRKKNVFTLALTASSFQIQVWQALLTIPPGQLSTYKKIAEAIGKPQSSRAVAQALASNPIAYLIPCHRILRSDGSLSGYRWGPVRKQAMIAYEAAQLEKQTGTV
jgi:AraC family transcriptional regulator of adaptative response/methylated-DNA-[protein]-cysteine methyltransferase